MKIGDRVRIIGNGAHSSHKIGDIGIIKEMNYQNASPAHSLISVKGICDRRSCWSYNYDLQKIPYYLNNIKIL